MNNRKRNILILALLVAAGVFLYSLSLFSFLLFHFVAELIAVIVGCLVFTVSTLSRRFVKAGFLTQVGSGFLAASIVTLLHLLSHEGIALIPGTDANQSAQLWAIQSFALAASLLVSFANRRDRNRGALQMVLTLVGSTALAGLAFARLLPTIVRSLPANEPHGSGLVPLGFVFESGIVLLYLASLFFLSRWKRGGDISLRRKMHAVIALLAASEIFYILGSDAFGLFSFFTHFLRMLGFLLVYESVVVEGIQKPYRTVFSELNDLSRTDGLTGLHNHRHFLEMLTTYCDSARTSSKVLYLMVFDIDRFKSINDRFGHSVGDQVLQEAGRVVLTQIRATDVACRQGGDEFSVVFHDMPPEHAERIVDRFRRAFLLASLTEEGIHLTISGGIVRYRGENPEELVKRADRLLYAAKSAGRDRIYFDSEDETA